MSEIDMKVLDVTGGILAGQGFEANGFAVEYFKDDLFSEAHNILMSFVCNPPYFDHSWNIQITQDHDGTEYPDVFQAWINAGGDQNVLPSVAKLPDLGKWGVGFGGKKNGERAAKLALAASIALDSDLWPQISREWPAFETVVNQALAGGVSGSLGGGGGKGKGKGGGKNGRSSPYGDAGGYGASLGEQLAGMMKGKGKGDGKGGGKMDALWNVIKLLGGDGGDEESAADGDDWTGGKGGDSWKGGKGGDSWKGGKGGDKGGDSWKGGKGGDKGGDSWKGGDKGGDNWKGGKGGGKCKGGGKGPVDGPDLSGYPNETKVWVGKLPEGTTSKTLEEHFGLLGGIVVGATVLRKGTGVVAYQTAEQANDAIALLNNSDMGGSSIQVDVWTSK